MRRVGFLLVAVLLVACSSPAADDTTPEPTDELSLPSDPGPVANTGIITFGTRLNEETLKVRGERDTFKVGQQIAWSASLSEPVGATSVQVLIAEKKAGGSETVSYEEEIDVANPDFDLLANRVRLGLLLDGPGRYVMRYINLDGEVLAEGSFRLVR